MQVLSDNDYKLIKTLVKMNQRNLQKTLYAYLDKKYDTVYKTKDYLMAIGNIPVALVAHMDTVFDKLPENIYYDEKQGVLWSSEGLGADDRAGVFGILKILQKNMLPTVIFTTDEEVGALGAAALIKDFPIPPTNINYIIELDRRGTNDCVFYECDNKDFIKYVEKYGFIENFGSFSDISIICPGWGIAGVNLSIGYEDEHSYVETLHINPLFSTINKIITMLKDKNIPKFKYIPQLLYPGFSFKFGYDLEDEDDIIYECEICHKHFCEYEVIPVMKKSGELTYYCPDCCVDRINWCDKCGKAFEGSYDTHLCYNCEKEAHKDIAV